MVTLQDESRRKIYLKKSTIGKGTFGNCFKVVDTSTKKRYACKELTDGREFRLEVSIHSELRHCNIVRFVSSFDYEKKHYILMELCQYGSLREIINKHHCLENSYVRIITKQIVHGLQYLHESLIIHRDIKLSNILIGENCTVKIADFGLATHLESNADTRESVCGTKNYWAPEIIEDERYSFAVDIWALGCVFYTLLVSYEPFAAVNDTETCLNISTVTYPLSRNLNESARKLLKSIFVHESRERATAGALLGMEYFKEGAKHETLFPLFVRKGRNVGKKEPFKDKTNTVMFNKKDKTKSEKSDEDTKFFKTYESDIRKEEVFKENVRPKEVLKEKTDIVELGKKETTEKSTKTIKCSAVYESDVIIKEQLKERAKTVEFIKNKRGKSEKSAECLKLCESDTKAISDKNIKTGKKTTFKIFEDECGGTGVTDFMVITEQPPKLLLRTIKTILRKKMSENNLLIDATSSSSIFITRWVGFEPQGLGYHLNDGSLGVMFHDKSHLLRKQGGKMVYIPFDGRPIAFTMDDAPSTLSDKLVYAKLIHRHLLSRKRSGPSTAGRSNIWPFVSRFEHYFESDHKHTTAFYLSVGTCQVNFANHEKIVINKEEMRLICMQEETISHYSLSQLQRYGAPCDIKQKMEFAARFLELISH